MRAMTQVWRVIFLLSETESELNLLNEGNDPCVEGNKTEMN